MKKMIILSALLLFSKYAYAQGELQILCEPGVSIYVNGISYGKTNAQEEGKFIENLPTGHLIVKAVKSGYEPIEKTISLEEGILKEMRISLSKHREEVKALEDETSGTLVKEVGILILRAVPPRPKAKVYIDGKSYGSGNKEISGIDIGKHEIVWVKNNDKIVYTVNLLANQEISLKADFRNKTVQDSSSGGQVPSRLISITELHEYEENKCMTYSKYELRIMRNAIFAKKGRMFNSSELQEYFSRFSWYQPRIRPEEFDANNILSDSEKNLIKKITRCEKRK